MRHTGGTGLALPQENERTMAPRVSEEDCLRADLYGLLGRLLVRPPSPATLDELRGLSGDSSELGLAITELAAVARDRDAKAVAREYHDLFIGVGRGALLPYASYYLTGFLNEKPLARLRKALQALGVARDPTFKDPEDHIGALMSVMAGLIAGAFDEPRSLDVQRGFFECHIAPWATHFFADLEAADAAVLYRPVGAVGRLFMGIEETAFRMF